MTNAATAPADTNAPAWAGIFTRRAIDALPVDYRTATAWVMATPPQVDEVIRTTQLDQIALENSAKLAMENLRRALGQEQAERPSLVDFDWRGRPRTERYWPISVADTIAAAAAADPAAPAAGFMFRGPETIGEAIEAYNGFVAQIREAREIERMGHTEYARRGGWARYYRVNNANGHVHVTRDCRNTFATTEWNWPTHLSGGTDADVVEAAGALTCLTCFPEVREDILADRPCRFEMFETPEQTEERQAREAEKAEKLAAKIAKGITPDGKPLEVRIPGYRGNLTTVEIKTARAAELRYVEYRAEQASKRNDPAEQVAYNEAAMVLADALAAKRGVTRDEVIAELAPKVARKVSQAW